MINTKEETIIPIDKSGLRNHTIITCLFPGILVFLLGPLYLIFFGWNHLPLWLRNYKVSYTDTSLIIRSGVFFKSKKVISFTKITDFVLKQGPFMAMCGIQNISIQTAGQGSGVPEAILQAVKSADDALDMLVFLHEKNN